MVNVQDQKSHTHRVYYKQDARPFQRSKKQIPTGLDRQTPKAESSAKKENKTYVSGQGPDITWAKNDLAGQAQVRRWSASYRIKFFFILPNLIFNFKFFPSQHQMLNLFNTSEDRKCVYYYLLNFNPFLHIGQHISRIFPELLIRKWPPTAVQELCANPTCVGPLERGALHSVVFKRVRQI